MENKRSPRGLEAFFAGKGFYIVLSLCIVIVGVTVWAMLTRAGTKEEPEALTDFSELDAYRAAEYSSETPVYPMVPDTAEGGVDIAEESGAALPEDEADGTAASPVELKDESTASVWNPDEAAVLSQQSFYWPVNGDIEVPYSMDALVYNPTLSDWRTHAGLDIACALGEPVMAAGSGRVESIYTDDLYGVTLVIDHMGGLKSVYANLAETPTVSVGDGVVAGEIIGAVGTTAIAETGEVTHLHFGMTLDGQSIDPTEYLP